MCLIADCLQHAVSHVSIAIPGHTQSACFWYPHLLSRRGQLCRVSLCPKVALGIRLVFVLMTLVDH